VYNRCVVKEILYLSKGSISSTVFCNTHWEGVRAGGWLQAGSRLLSLVCSLCFSVTCAKIFLIISFFLLKCWLTIGKNVWFTSIFFFATATILSFHTDTITLQWLFHICASTRALGDLWCHWNLFTSWPSLWRAWWGYCTKWLTSLKRWEGWWLILLAGKVHLSGGAWKAFWQSSLCALKEQLSTAWWTKSQSSVRTNVLGGGGEGVFLLWPRAVGIPADQGASP